jgi:hypothetical protein
MLAAGAAGIPRPSTTPCPSAHVIPRGVTVRPSPQNGRRYGAGKGRVGGRVRRSVEGGVAGAGRVGSLGGSCAVQAGGSFHCPLQLAGIRQAEGTRVLELRVSWDAAQETGRLRRSHSIR